MDVTVPYPLVSLRIDVGPNPSTVPAKDSETTVFSSMATASARDRYLLKSPERDVDLKPNDLKIKSKGFSFVKLSIVPRQYERSLLLHKYVLESRIEELKSALEKNVYDVNSVDSFGNTPLILAATLGRTEFIRLLIKHGARIKTRNHDGWNALNEAVSYGNFDNIRLLWSEAKRQMGDDLRIRATQIRESVERLKDMYVRLDWRFRSWLPFVSSFCPFDTIQIWKRGNAVRVQATLVGMKSYRWQRGNIAFLFNFRRGKQFSGLLLNNEAKTYATIQGLEKAQKDDEKRGTKWEKAVNREASSFMSLPIQRTNIPGHLKFQRAMSGVIFTSEKVGKVGDHDTRIFNVSNLKIINTTRMEHMSSEEIKQWKENTNGPSSASELTQQLREVKAKAEEEEETEKNWLLEGPSGPGEGQRVDQRLSKDFNEKGDDDDDDSDEDFGEFVPHRDLTPPPSPERDTVRRYLRLAEDASHSDDSKTVKTIGKKRRKTIEKEWEEAVKIGRQRKIDKNVKDLRPEIHMCDDFPVTKNMVVTLLDLVAPHHPNISKLRNFLTVKMPEGFPVKLTLPVFPTISADVTFAECRIGSNEVPSNMFELPPEYERVELGEILLKKDSEAVTDGGSV